MRHCWMYCFFAASIFAGCGATSPPPISPARTGIHQGRLIKLPGDSGFVEVVVEDTRSSPRSIAREVVAYFYGPDSKSPLSPAPTDVAVEVYLAESKTRGTIPLKPAEAADGATVGRRFAAASPPGFDGFIRSGKLLSRHEGREFNIAF